MLTRELSQLATSPPELQLFVMLGGDFNGRGDSRSSAFCNSRRGESWSSYSTTERADSALANASETASDSSLSSARLDSIVVIIAAMRYGCFSAE